MAQGLIDRAAFYAKFPAAKLYGKTLTPARKQGFEAIFDAWDALPHVNFLTWLAYALATAWHETGGTMQPVREGFAKTDALAFAAVTAYCKRQGIPNYAKRNEHGMSYYGRGYVQLTFAVNYDKMGQRLKLGTSLVDDPDRVMDPHIAARILLLGLMEGLFRPKHGSLLDYFNGQEQQWFEARDMVNGDKSKIPKWTEGKSIGEIIGTYGRAFSGALSTT